jgi:hypothetical protein
MIAPPSGPVPAFPPPLSAYPPASPDGLFATLAQRVEQAPFNLVATIIFFLAIFHTFLAKRVTDLAHDAQHRDDERRVAAGRRPRPCVKAELLHFFGEVEVIFGLWASVLAVAMFSLRGWDTVVQYFDSTVNYTEPLFVVVIMALASTRPILTLAESALARVARLGGGTAAAWWVSILVIGPLLGSFITEPAAMTICALLLARYFFPLPISERLKYGTLGLLFVNVSIGGTLTNFAAPPVLMVARPWHWDFSYMLGHFGWKAVVGVVLATAAYRVVFHRELAGLGHVVAAGDRAGNGVDASPEVGSVPVAPWVAAVHVAFMAWTVLNAHHPALFLGGFLFFLGFAKATMEFQSPIDLKPPLLVGFFLAGLVIHGGLQAWWIAPVLASLSASTLFYGAIVLTAFNDNALVTYLATLVPNLSEGMKDAVVAGAVAGGGLTVIANAPNPAGQALLARFFGGAVSPLGLLLGAIVPTLVAMAALHWLP